VSAGNDVAYIDGGEDADTLTINANDQNFAVYAAQGNLMYQSGTGGSVITVVNVEHGTVVAPGGTTLYSW